MKEWYISFVLIQEELEMYRAMRAEARSLEEKMVKNIKGNKKIIEYVNSKSKR